MMGSSILVPLTLQFLAIVLSVCSASNYNSSDIAEKWFLNKRKNSIDCVYYLKHKNFTGRTNMDFKNALLNIAKAEAVRAKSIVSDVAEVLHAEEHEKVLKRCGTEFQVALSQLTLAQDINSSETDKSRVSLSKALAIVESCEIESSVVLYRLIENVVSDDGGNPTHSTQRMLRERKKHGGKGKKHRHHHKHGHHHYKHGHRIRGFEGGHHMKQLTRGNGAGNRIVVAKDGSGNYRTIKEAIGDATERRRTISERITIYIKEGDYSENVDIDVPDLNLEGDGIGKTNIIGSKFNTQTKGSTDGTRTLGILKNAVRFVAQGITVQNVAPPGNRNHQAVALLSEADKSAFYKCSFEGYQDTLYAKSGKQFYRECEISGAIDFIMGDAAAIFQKCKIILRAPLQNVNEITITASSRDTNGPTGLVIHESRVEPEEDLEKRFEQTKRLMVYLGRPWKKYARTVFMRTELPDRITKGYVEMKNGHELDVDRVYLGEFENKGEGADTAERVDWGGVRRSMSRQEAEQFTVDRFIQGNTWIPSYIPRDGGL